MDQLKTRKPEKVYKKLLTSAKLNLMIKQKPEWRSGQTGGGKPTADDNSLNLVVVRFRLTVPAKRLVANVIFKMTYNVSRRALHPTTTN